MKDGISSRNICAVLSVLVLGVGEFERSSMKQKTSTELAIDWRKLDEGRKGGEKGGGG